MENPGESRPLVSLMCSHWRSQATDERDIIYALAGLASDCQVPALSIDYSVPTWTVYLQTLAFLLQNTGSLDMIAYSGIGHQPLGRPTWAPSFYCPDGSGPALTDSQKLFNATGVHPFTASKGVQARARFLASHRLFDKPLGIDRTILQVEGCRVDTISQQLLYRGKNTSLKGRQLGSLKLGLGRNALRKYRISSSNWMRSKHRRHALDIIKILYLIVVETPCPGHIDGEQATPEERLEELWRTLTYERTPGGQVAPEEWSQAISVLINGPSVVPTNFEPAPSISNFSNANRAISFTRPLLGAIENLFSGDAWLFMSKTGRLGIANRNARINDFVYVIPGCNMPVVVRKDKPARQDDIFNGTLHGSAYIHHYMYGKAIEDLNAGKLGVMTLNLK